MNLSHNCCLKYNVSNEYTIRFWQRFVVDPLHPGKQAVHLGLQFSQ